MSNEIVVDTRLELDGLKKDIDDAKKHSEDAAHEMGEKIGEKLEEGFKKPFEGLKEKFVEIAAAISAAFTFEKAIEAASETEAVINRLNSALAVTGAYSEEATEHIQHYAEELQKTTTASKDAILSGASLLVTLGKLSGDGLDRATKASLDLSAALHIDQATAFNLVAKAAEGHVQSLARYGIQVKATGDQAKDFASALKLLETRFGGLAEMQANTFSGAWTKMKNMFTELLVPIGDIVVKSPLVIAIFNALSDAFEHAAEAVKHFTAGKDLVSEFATILITFGQTLNTYVIAPLEFVYNLGKVVFEGLKTGIQTALLAVVTAVSDVTGVLAMFSDKFKAADDAVKTFAASTEDTLNTFVSDTNKTMSEVFDFNVASASSNFLEKAQQFVNQVKPVLKTNFQAISDGVTVALKGITFDQVVSAMQGAGAKMKITAESIAKTLNDTFINGASNAFAAFGGALATGKNAFEAFGQSVLKSLGGILIQFGTMLIAIGIGLSTVPFLFGLSGVAAVGAGIAAVILGGALQALGGGGGDSTSAPAGGAAPASGGVASGGTSAPPDAIAASFNDTQRNNVGTNVNVNIQGNVFDTKQTGMHIADILSDTFGSNGVTFAGAQLS